jgi:hypothetical protein
VGGVGKAKKEAENKTFCVHCASIIPAKVPDVKI